MRAHRSILLHIDASPRSQKRLIVARNLSALFGARVSALYASTPTVLSLPFTMAQGAEEMFAVLQQLDIDYRDNARMLFDRAESTEAEPIGWHELTHGDVVHGFAARALCSDLLVLGQHDAGDPLTVGVPSDFVPSVLLASGRPALVVPYVDVATTLGRQVLIAWKPTREAARAVTAAIPFLLHAKRVHVTIAGEQGDAAEQAATVENYLRLHGVQASIQRHAGVPAQTPGDGLLSLAADVGADLLVMGCYGHSRARELVLGGASRTVLGSMTLPVLMAH